MNRSIGRLLVLVVLIVGFGLLFTSPTLRLEAPQIRAAGHGFDVATAEYAERAKEVFQQADARRKELNASGRFYHTGSLWASWIGFACTTLITAIAVFFTPGVDPEQAKTTDSLTALQKRLKKHAWIIGLLAAGGASCAALSERASKEASQVFGCANEMMQLVNETRIRLMDEKLPAADALGLLDALENKVSQACAGVAK